ncbi:MAG: beta-ketoacyl-[acyl-carrier-protein] synthase family protein [Thermodesulforhabdaceae bacterium]
MERAGDARRPVITAMDLITPLGVGLDTSWERLIRGDSGISRITLFDPENHKIKIAGECREFHPDDFLDKKFIARYDRMFQLFVAVALLAAEKARITSHTAEDPYRLSVVGASAIGCPSTFEHNYRELIEKGPRKVSPFCVINAAGNPAAGEVARIFNAKGPQYFLQEACAAGTKAIGLASKLIKADVIDMAIVVGADAGITPTLMASLANLGAIADPKWNDVPEKASRPFDKLRSGFVPSEGAGCVIIEAFEHAVKRGATPLAEVAGFGATCDAYHPVSPEPSAESIVKCMRKALEDADLSPEDVDYINAHGTSTPLNDVAETRGIKEVFSERAYVVPISSNKSMIGHTWGAAGVIETIFSVKVMLEGLIPPTINLESPDPQCDLDYVPNIARKQKIRVVLKNSFGFGGINGSLVLRSLEGGES